MVTTTIRRSAQLVAGRYNRASDDRRKLSRSVEEQDDEGLEVTHANGWIDGGSYTDNDLSSSRFARKARPDWLRLVSDIEAGRLDVLIIWETSRASRMLSAWATMLETCQRLGVLIHVTSHQQTYNLSNPRHWRTLADEGVDAVYEVEKTSHRVRRGTKSAAAAGRPHGKVLYGYRRVYDSRTRELVEQAVREDQAAIVRECANRIAAGEGIGKVTRDLNDRGVPTPRGGAKWEIITVRKMLLRASYIGKRVHQGQVVGDAQWPRILEPAVYWACHQILTDPDRHQHRDGAVHHLMSGLGFCGKPGCGAILRVYGSRNAPNYQCSTLRRCTAIRKDVLDELVRDLVIERLSRPDIIDLISDDSRDDDARQAEAEAEQLRAELEAYYQQAEAPNPDERLSPAGLARMENNYLPRIEAAERRASELRIPPALRAVARPDIAQHWEKLDITQEREVIRELMTVTLLPVGRGRRTDPIDRVRIDWRHAVTPAGSPVAS